MNTILFGIYSLFNVSAWIMTGTMIFPRDSAVKAKLASPPNAGKQMMSPWAFRNASHPLLPSGSSPNLICPSSCPQSIRYMTSWPQSLVSQNADFSKLICRHLPTFLNKHYENPECSRSYPNIVFVMMEGDQFKVSCPMLRIVWKMEKLFQATVRASPWCQMSEASCQKLPLLSNDVSASALLIPQCVRPAPLSTPHFLLPPCSPFFFPQPGVWKEREEQRRQGNELVCPPPPICCLRRWPQLASLVGRPWLQKASPILDHRSKTQIFECQSWRRHTSAVSLRQS